MQLSKLKLNTNIEKQMFETFYQAIADIGNKSETEIFLKDFLSKVERIKLAKRLMVAWSLEKGKSYDFIKENFKVSSATIASVDKMMTKKSAGFSLIFRKIEAEEWASKTAKKITEFFQSIAKFSSKYKKYKG